MTILNQTEPKQGRRIVHAALGRRLHRAAHMPSLRGTPKTGSPLPLYQLTAAGAVQAGLLARARRVGWHYPVIGGDVPGLACLKHERGGLSYTGLIEGALPQRLVDAALLVERELPDDEVVYQPRLLSIPAFQLLALWMYRARGASHFVSLSEARLAPHLKLEGDLRHIIRRASRRMKLGRRRKFAANRKT